jgi:hypothetical protein
MAQKRWRRRIPVFAERVEGRLKISGVPQDYGGDEQRDRRECRENLRPGKEFETKRLRIKPSLRITKWSARHHRPADFKSSSHNSYGISRTFGKPWIPGLWRRWLRRWPMPCSTYETRAGGCRISCSPSRPRSRGSTSAFQATSCGAAPPQRQTTADRSGWEGKIVA